MVYQLPSGTFFLCLDNPKLSLQLHLKNSLGDICQNSAAIREGSTFAVVDDLAVSILELEHTMSLYDCHTVVKPYVAPTGVEPAYPKATGSKPVVYTNSTKGP